MTPQDFAGRYGPWALVAGAGLGIGRAFGLALAEHGLSVVLIDRDPAPNEALADEIRAAGGTARTETFDLGELEAADRFAALAEELEIGLGIYCAATTYCGRYLDEPLAGLRQRVAVNCAGPDVMSHTLAKPMVERGRGGLILLSSMAGLQGTGWVASYSATKAFDLALAEALWYELGEHGVDVLALLPGTTDTPGMRSSGARGDRSGWMQPEEVVSEGIAALGQEPVHVCGEANRQIVAAFAGMPREQRLRIMGEQTRKLYE